MLADGTVLTLLRPVIDAFVAGRYVLMIALTVVMLTGLFRKFGSPTSWVHTTPGGTLLALLTSSATAVAVTLAVPDAVVTWNLLWTALMVGVTSAGGYVVIKNLLIDPVLRPLSLRAPIWSLPLFKAVFWIFDKPDGVPPADPDPLNIAPNIK